MARKAAKRMRLTGDKAGGLRPAESEYTVWDSKTAGFGVRIRPTGSRVWVYHSSDSGRPRRYTLGPVLLKTSDEARRECLEINLKELAGGTVDETVKAAAPVFRDFIEGQWKTECCDLHNPSYRKRVSASLNSRILPTFGKLPLNRITRSRINRWFDKYSRSAPGGANRAIDILSGILNHAILCGHIAVNPAQGIRRNPRRKMSRFLSRTEIRRLHAVLEASVAVRPANAPKADIIRLLLLTGCRRGEILGLRWREVGEHVLELVDSQGRPRIVLLSPHAKAIIERQREPGSQWVFPSPRDQDRHLSTGSLDGFWNRIRKRTGIEDVRLLDLRHSVASQAVLEGVSPPVVARLLGHSRMSMTHRYAHVADRDIEAAAERVGSVIADVCGI